MHQRAEPGTHTVRPAELVLADKTVQASIPIADVAAEMLAQSIFLDPVDLEVAERLAVPAADDGNAVSAGEAALEELFLVGQRALLAPEVRHAGVVHPSVQQLRV